ncbi:MAG: hypothetical protein H6627_15050 [Calditrichae bacterium]|nr:hypothetical protein [Calditrichia bacterium]
MYEAYHFKIEKHDIHYSYCAYPSVFDPRRKRSTHNEYCHVTLIASIVHPEKVKGRKVEITLMGERSIQLELAKKDVDRETTNWIGAIDLHRESKIVYLTVPNDKIFEIYGLISSKVFQEIISYGPPLKYNKARLRSVKFYSNLDVEEHY